MVPPAHSTKVDGFPFDGRQPGNIGEIDERPVRTPAPYRRQERAVPAGECVMNVRDEPLARLGQRDQRNRLVGHMPELAFVERADGLAPRGQQLDHRPVVADHIDQKGHEQAPVDALVVQQLRDVKQIARVLPVERRAHLARIEVVERQDPVLGVAWEPAPQEDSSKEMSRLRSIFARESALK